MTIKLVEVQRFSVISAKTFKDVLPSLTRPSATPIWPHFSAT